jgi:hypothetical protein
MNPESFHGSIRYTGRAVETAEVRDDHIEGALFDELVAAAGWKKPPHEALVNLELDKKTDLEAFVRTYGILHAHWVTEIEATEARAKWRKTRAGRSRFHLFPLFHGLLSDLATAQDLLRRAWKGEARGIVAIEKEIEEGFEVGTFKLRYGSPVLKTDDLWKYSCFLFLLSSAAGGSKICERDGCPTPYFIQRRRGQKFCSHECAVLVSVRRFRSK